MLTITNSNDGNIVDTNYWRSEYNSHGLAYLSGHHLGLRLLLPSKHVTEWLPEIKTGKRVIIEPTVRSGYLNHIDIVFDDGTSTPFSLCIDRTRQSDAALRSGDTRVLVYTDHTLQNPLVLPCTIILPDSPKQDFLTHATANTKHARRSYRHEVSDNVVAVLKSWLPDLLSGKQRGLLDDRYAVRSEWHNNKAIGFIVSRLNEHMQPTDIVKFAVCRHSKRAIPAWEFVGGNGRPPRVPFVAAGLVLRDMSETDMVELPTIADFERCLAWAWLESIEEGKEKHA